MPMAPHEYDPGEDPRPTPRLRPERGSATPWLLLGLVGLGAGYAAYWGVGERQRLEAELARAGAAAAGRAELEARVAALDEEKAALLSARANLEKSVEAKDGELSQLKETHDRIKEKMKDEIAKGEIELSQAGGRLRVDLVDKILFDSGDAQISKRGEGVLARVGAILGKVADRQIQVLGHTDNQPINGKLKEQFASNWELSATRALNVVRFLEERAEVPGERLVASGHGQHAPIASNKTPAGRARNRRIEILLTPAFDARRVARGKLETAARAGETAKAEEGAPKRGETVKPGEGARKRGETAKPGEVAGKRGDKPLRKAATLATSRR